MSPAGADTGDCGAEHPCRSFDRAYQLARPGERVAVAAGSYPLQRIAPPLKPRGGRAVAFAPAGGAKVSVEELVVDGSRVSFAGLRTGSWTAGPTARRVTFRDVHVAGGIFVTGARRVRVLGGSVGPGTNFSSEIKAAQPGGAPPRDVVIDGVRFHDWVRDNEEAHVDCLHVLAADGLVIRRSSFRNCEAFAVLLTGYGAAASPTNVLVEGDHIICCRSGYAGVSLGSATARRGTTSRSGATGRRSPTSSARARRRRGRGCASSATPARRPIPRCAGCPACAGRTTDGPRAHPAAPATASPADLATRTVGAARAPAEDRWMRWMRWIALALVLLAGLAAPAAAQAAAPAGVTGIALDGRVELAWQPAAGAASYASTAGPPRPRSRRA